MIHRIDDLATASVEEVKAVLDKIDLKGLIYRQMTKDGRRTSMTRDVFEEMVANARPHLCKACGGQGEIQPHFRSIGTVHPSAAHRCRLKLYYDVLAEMEGEEEISPELQLIFDIGHAIHATIQKAIHRALPDSFVEEVTVNLPESFIENGHADGVVEQPDHTYVIEIKTISSDGYSKLSKPKEEHVLQASIYCRALNVPFMCFLYIDKGTGSMKQYPMVYDERVYQNWRREKIEPIEKALETGTEPIADAGKYECSGCGYRNNCAQRLGGSRNPFAR